MFRQTVCNKMVQNQSTVTHRAVVLSLLQDNEIVYDARKAFYMLSPRDIVFYVNAFIYADLWMKNYNANGPDDYLQKIPYTAVNDTEAATLIGLAKTNKAIDSLLNSQFRSWNPKTWGLVCIEFSCSVIKNKLIKSPYLKEQKTVTSTTLCTMNQYSAQEKRELETLCTEKEMELLRKKCSSLEQECTRLKSENEKLKKEKDIHIDRVRRVFKIMESDSHEEEHVVNLGERTKRMEGIRRNSIVRAQSEPNIGNEASKGSVPKPKPTPMYH